MYLAVNNSFRDLLVTKHPLLDSKVAPMDLLLQGENSVSPLADAWGNMMYLGEFPVGLHSGSPEGSCYMHRLT